MTADCRAPDVKLVHLDLPPILSPVEIGRFDRSVLPQMLHEASLDPDPANMFMRLSLLFHSLGSIDLGHEMHQRALEHRRVYRYRCALTPKVRLMAIMGPQGGLDNAPLEYLLENSDIRLDLVFLDEDGCLPEAIPDHDIAIVGLGESYKNRGQFERLISSLRSWPRPIINQPAFVLNCSRDKLYDELKGVPQLVLPQTRRVKRDVLSVDIFPKIIRPVDTHGGEGLAKIDSEGELQIYLESSDAAEFYVSDFVDFRSGDGLYRKLRIALIDGRPYICHLAITDHWIVHYIPAGMDLSAAKRAEEKGMMETFEAVFVKRHHKTLQAIHEKLGLDYVILDCAVMRDGALLLFEADTRGWIHGVDPVDIFPYKPAIMQKAFDGFRQMLLSRMSHEGAAHTR